MLQSGKQIEPSNGEKNENDQFGLVNFNDPKFNNDWLDKLRYCIQSLSFPKITFKSFNGTAAGEGIIDGSNMLGTYSILGNSFLGIDSKQIQAKILNTQSPVIEKFLYPWMLNCIQSKVYGRCSF